MRGKIIDNRKWLRVKEPIDQLIASGDLEDQRGEAFIPSRPIDWSRCVDQSRSVDRTAFDKALTGIQDELVASEERQRQRGHAALSCFRKPTGEEGIAFTDLVKRLHDQGREILNERLDIDGLTVVGLNFSDTPLPH